MNEIQQISISQIDRPNPPIRLSLDGPEIEALTESVRSEGILTPLLLRRKGERYEVIDGDRRLEAAYRLRLATVPSMVRDASDSETHVLRIIANLERSDTDPVSDAIYYSKIIASEVLTADELAQKLHRSVEWVMDRLAISEMPDYLQDALRGKKVSLGAAFALAQITDERVRRDWVAAAVRDGMSVRGAEDALREFLRYADQHGTNEEGAVLGDLPSAPPVIYFPCARCGVASPLEDLKLVRIHKDGCGEGAGAE